VAPPNSTAAAHRQSLLALREVGSWFKDHASAATARTQLDQLELFCRRVGREPTELLNLAKKSPRTLEDLVQDYVRRLQDEGKSSRYALNSWWGVRSFLAHNDTAPSWVPKLKPVAEDDDDGTETVPTVEQLRAILSVLSSRGRAVALLLASSGIRIGVLATQFGPSEGLRLKHLPELSIDPEPHFEKVPFLVRVPSYLAKGSTVSRPRGYLTFGNAEAAEAIAAYLKERVSKGESLNPNSALVAPDGRGRTSDRIAKDGTRFMARKALAFTLRSAMERMKPKGVHWHAHTLRAWFSTQMEAAEARGLISHSRREFFMGHSGGGVDFDYNLDRPKSSAKIEDLRASYRRCEAYLAVHPTTSNSEMQARAAKVMLMGLGYTERELAKIDFEDLDMELFQDLVAKKTGSSIPPARQKLVDSTQLGPYLDRGWTLVTVVNDHQVVLNPPVSE
jgi:integrase